MHVLFVDDDEMVAQSVEMALRANGHDCETTDEGGTALALSKRNNYDIVVLDVGLPDMDGYHVARRMKMEGVDTPLLMQSGLDDAGLPADAESLGCRDFLPKPFSIAELLEHMEAVLGISEPAEPGLAPDAQAAPAPSAPRSQPQARAKSAGTVWARSDEPAPPPLPSGPVERPSAIAAARAALRNQPEPPSRLQAASEALAENSAKALSKAEHGVKALSTKAEHSAKALTSTTEHGAKAFSKIVTKAKSAVGPKDDDEISSRSEPDLVVPPAARSDTPQEPSSEAETEDKKAAKPLSKLVAKARSAVESSPLAGGVDKARSAFRVKPDALAQATAELKPDGSDGADDTAGAADEPETTAKPKSRAKPLSMLMSKAQTALDANPSKQEELPPDVASAEPDDEMEPTRAPQPEPESGQGDDTDAVLLASISSELEALPETAASPETMSDSVPLELTEPDSSAKPASELEAEAEALSEPATPEPEEVAAAPETESESEAEPITLSDPEPGPVAEMAAQLEAEAEPEAETASELDPRDAEESAGEPEAASEAGIAVPCDPAPAPVAAPEATAPFDWTASLQSEPQSGPALEAENESEESEVAVPCDPAPAPETEPEATAPFDWTASLQPETQPESAAEAEPGTEDGGSAESCGPEFSTDNEVTSGLTDALPPQPDAEIAAEAVPAAPSDPAPAATAVSGNGMWDSAEPKSAAESVGQFEGESEPETATAASHEDRPVMPAAPEPDPVPELETDLATESEFESGPEPELEAQPAPEPEPADDLAVGGGFIAAEAPEKTGAERRRHERKTVIEAAVIADGGNNIPCAILDLSESGAMLLVSSPDLEFSENFVLRPLDGEEHNCILRWRDADRIGIEFT